MSYSLLYFLLFVRYLQLLKMFEVTQGWGFRFCSIAMVLLGLVLNIVTFGSQTHTEVRACD